MPIVKTDETIQLEFGTGDIEVNPGLLKDSTLGVVCFYQKETVTEIGTHTENPPGYSLEINETPVRLVFEKTESIDVLI
jgi:hypothetical protein